MLALEMGEHVNISWTTLRTAHYPIICMDTKSTEAACAQYDEEQTLDSTRLPRFEPLGSFFDSFVSFSLGRRRCPKADRNTTCIKTKHKLDPHSANTSCGGRSKRKPLRLSGSRIASASSLVMMEPCLANSCCATSKRCLALYTKYMRLV